MRRQSAELAVAQRVLLLRETHFIVADGRCNLSNHGLRAVDVLELGYDLHVRQPRVPLQCVHIGVHVDYLIASRNKLTEQPILIFYDHNVVCAAEFSNAKLRRYINAL